MADITFSCSGCGESLQAPAEFTGESVECPSCNADLVVPAPADAAAPAGNVCQKCGNAMEADAVLCLSCGFHSGLGKVIETSFD